MPKRWGIALWLGNREQGKTTGMVRDLVRELEAKTAYKKGYSNIKINHPDIEQIKYEELKDLRADNKNGVPTALLGLDQLHKYLDSRQSNSARNKYMTDIIIESRQHGFDLRGTTWMRSSIDLRVRNFNELHILAERVRKGFQYTFVDTESGPLGQRVLSYKNAERWWAYFDTTELIEDIPANWDPRVNLVAPYPTARK